MPASTMIIADEATIRQGAKIVDFYGSWHQAIEAGTRREDGVVILPAFPAEFEKEHEERNARLYAPK